MRTRLAAVGSVLAFLIMAGAGCPQLNFNREENKPENSDTSAVQDQTPAAPNDFTLRAEAVGTGIVKFSWTPPADVDAGATFRLLHSAKANPAFPGAFWYQRPGADRETIWGNLPDGPRHFRVCEFKDNKCVRYSNDVELELK